MTDRRRLLILVVAYYAESTLLRVLDRIPGEVFDAFECEVLVVDDASADRTFELAERYRLDHPQLPIAVLRNRFNQGYGGNQKIGYAYAVSREFDLVAMIHGDGQYAPEELPRLLEPFDGGDVDAVFGSRMMIPGAARAGGMPPYKRLGNRILTTVQNLMLGTQLTEFHSGYRVYAVAALDSIHYRLNSNGFHFDTEVILQLLSAGRRIVELPIPTFYGDEISRVNGVAYAVNVLQATAQATLHRRGLRHQRRFEPRVDDNRHYRLKLGYPSSHQWALDAVPSGASVLDIGAGPGGMATALAAKGCRVAVVDQHPPNQATHGVEVYVQDLDKPLDLPTDRFDYLLLLDVIEHLKDPERFLDQLRAGFGYQPKTIVLTTPNIAFCVQRLGLLAGQFNYGRSGILDRTHTRLFTFRTLRHLLRDAGLEIREMRGIPAPIPEAIGDSALSRALLRANLALIRLSRGAFSFQIFVVAHSTPDLDFLLADAVRTAAGRR
ncbi:MAG TPA: bifunctional glycosyltransferase/class I SAM-dependent methyltransferase [Egibacteraceae bacterium]|nr:bifunctional glycosyltransferase/class I SAM-dependent methyltransferase [Egibacteraceae bacterium]